MGQSRKTIIILMAEDDPDDRLLAKEALSTSDLLYRLDFVENGEEVMAYLNREGKFESFDASPLPSLILLDLNMPKKNGMEVLSEIKANPKFRRIPTVILTTSEQEEDVFRSYDIGANSFITKSVTLDTLVDIIQEIGKYWLEIVELPPDSSPKRPIN